MNPWRELCDRVARFFEKNSVVHLRRHEVETPSDLIDLVDRFLNNDVHYDMEWDDFISWENNNQTLEKFRQDIGPYEKFLASKSKTDRLFYCNKLIEKRNDLAAIVGIPARPPMSRLGAVSNGNWSPP